MQREPWGSDKFYRRGVFMPPEEEVLARVEDLVWLQERGFDEVLISSVMDFDMPEIGVVRRLVEKYGTLLAKEKLEPFIIRTEYHGVGPIPEDEASGGEAPQ